MATCNNDQIICGKLKEKINFLVITTSFFLSFSFLILAEKCKKEEYESYKLKLDLSSAFTTFLFLFLLFFVSLIDKNKIEVNNIPSHFIGFNIGVLLLFIVAMVEEKYNEEKYNEEDKINFLQILQILSFNFGIIFFIGTVNLRNLCKKKYLLTIYFFIGVSILNILQKFRNEKYPLFYLVIIVVNFLSNYVDLLSYCSSSKVNK
jgi:hypothetical protein